jgi:hypothetical protein
LHPAIETIIAIREAESEYEIRGPGRMARSQFVALSVAQPSRAQSSSTVADEDSTVRVMLHVSDVVERQLEPRRLKPPVVTSLVCRLCTQRSDARLRCGPAVLEVRQQFFLSVHAIRQNV